MAKQSIQVEERFHTTRLDKLLTNLNPEESRSQIQSWIKEGFVQVNGKKQKQIIGVSKVTSLNGKYQKRKHSN